MIIDYTEELDEYVEDDGTMPESIEALADAVIGHRIVSATSAVESGDPWNLAIHDLVLTLDNGQQVIVDGRSDCCAYTSVDKFLLHPEAVDHVITAVRTDGGYTNWHILADFGDVLTLGVDWSCGNPFYYSYGFNIQVKDANA